MRICGTLVIWEWLLPGGKISPKVSTSLRPQDMNQLHIYLCNPYSFSPDCTGLGPTCSLPAVSVPRGPLLPSLS